MSNALLFFGYYAAVIFAAYRVGAKSAGYGIALFFVAVALHQIVIDGTSSLIGGGCQTYGHAARDC
ncbi:MAG: hypothetical protein WBA88_19075 [Pseudaminobacter sp.]